MGYLTDNTPRTRNSVVCSDLYLYRIIVNPGFASDRELRTIIRDVIPDVEDWQFSGRRFCPVPRGNKIHRVIHPATYANNSRKMREYTETVVFAFRSTTIRDTAAARLASNGFSYTYQDEPTSSPGETVFIIVP